MNLQPPDARIPSTEEVRIFAAQTLDLFEKCRIQFEPASKLSDQIKLGLLTKQLKIFRNIFRLAEIGDGETPPILSRSIFEIALTITFLVLNEDEDNELYEKFRKSSLENLKQLVLGAEKSKYSGRKAAKEMIKDIKQQLLDEGYKSKQAIKKYPRSWHPDLSYYQMAKSVGNEFETFYSTFYATTSTFAHPNWLDIKRNHLAFKKTKAKSKTSSQIVPIPLLCFTMCLMLGTIEICCLKLTKTNKEININLVNKIRKLHHTLHNEKPNI